MAAWRPEDLMSFSLWTMACEGMRGKSGPGGCQNRTDAAAIHGPLGAQVALLQSLILPAAREDSAELAAGKGWKNGWS